MKMATFGPDQRKAFRGKSWRLLAVMALFFISLASKGQVADSAKYGTPISVYGGKHKRIAVDSVLLIPLSTSSHSQYRKGGIRYNPPDSSFEYYTGFQWLKAGGGAATNGIDTAYLQDDSLIVIETADETYVIPVRTRGRISGDTLFVGTDTLFLPVPDGSETKIIPGTNISVYGNGTTATPYQLYVPFFLEDIKISNDTLYYQLNGSWWFAGVLPSGGGGSPNLNVGSGYRVAVSGTNNIKTLFTDGTLSIDSTTNTNGLTIRADTTNDVATKWDISQVTAGAGEANTISSVGSGTSIVKGKVGVDLRVKSITSDATITLTGNTDDVNIKADTSVLHTNFKADSSRTNIYTALSARITGAGVSGRVPYWNGTTSQTSEAAFTYNATTNTLNADSFRTKTAYHDTTIYANGTITPDGDTLYTVGDSFTEGSNATSIPDSAYVGYMSRFYGLPLLNDGLGGTGASYSVWKHLEQVNPGHSFFSSAMFGFNNIKQAGNNQKTFRKIVNAAKTIFVNQFAKVSAAGGSTGQGLTRHGAGWNAPWPANSVGGKSSAAAYTNAINDSAKYAFTDSTVFFTVMGGDGSGSLYSPSNIDVYIDGVLIETYSPNNQTDGNVDIGEPSLDGKLIPCTRIYTGLTYGPHTLKIVNAQSGFMMLDFVGTLLDPYEGKTLLLWNPSHGTATGFAAGSYTLGSNALMDSIKVKFDSLKAALPQNFPFFLAQTNTLLNTAIHIDADSVHPNNAGMRDWLFPTAVAALGSGTNARPRQLFYANNRLWIVKNDGTIAPIVTGDVIYKGGQYSADTLKIGTVNNSIVSVYSNGTNIANFGTGFYGLDMMEKKLRAGDADLATGQIQLRNTITPASGVIAGIGRVGGRVGFILNRDQFGPAPDDNIWSINISNNVLHHQALSDDGSTGVSFLQAQRNTSSVAIDSVSLLAAWINLYGSIHLNTTPATGAESDALLVWNSTDKALKQIPNYGIAAVVTSDPDDWVAAVSTLTKLADLTGVGSHTVTLPSAAANTLKEIWLWNINASGNAWTFAAAITLPDGTTTTAFANGTLIKLKSDGSVWFQHN